MASLEGGHPLVVLCAGPRGIAPVRAALSWTPVLAHAGSCRVAVFYVAGSQASAAYLLEWDTWREAGVRRRAASSAHVAAASCWLGSFHPPPGLASPAARAPRSLASPAAHLPTAPVVQAHVHPLYLEEAGSGNGGAATAEQLLEQAALGGEGGLKAVLGGADPAAAAVSWLGGRRRLKGGLLCCAPGKPTRFAPAW